MDYSAKNSLFIAAICAAPSVLGHKGLLKGRKATCFPGFESALEGAEFCDVPCVRDGRIITACGAGAAFEFGFQVLEALTGDKQNADALRKNMLYTK